MIRARCVAAATAIFLWATAALADAAQSGIAGFIEAARDADIVVLGEVHDNPTHHRNQAEIVAALAPAALVFEMIPKESEAKVNALRAAGASRAALAAALDWPSSGWPDFGYYAAILEAAPEARVFGAGQPETDVRRAMLEGAARVFGPDAGSYGLDLPLTSDEQAAREFQQKTAHCDALPDDMLAGMVEAQRFRDAGLASAALSARLESAGGLVVVIAGTAHADTRRGMPALLALADPGTRVISLGQTEVATREPGNFDALLAAPSPKRDDPCAALRRAAD